MKLTRTINYTEESKVPAIGTVQMMHKTEAGKIVASVPARLIAREIVKRYRCSAIQVARYGSQDIWVKPVDVKLTWEMEVAA
jgi:hypothetical protein